MRAGGPVARRIAARVGTGQSYRVRVRPPDRVGDGRATTSAGTGVGADGPVRVAAAAEYLAIGQLTATAYAGGDVDEPDSYLQVLRDPASRPADCTVLAVDDADGTLLAATTYIPAGSTVSQVARPGEAELRMLAVRADARGRGIGGRVVRAALDRARAESRSALVLCVIEDNAGARALYERLGFARAPERDWHPNPTITLVAYRHALD